MPIGVSVDIKHSFKPNKAVNYVPFLEMIHERRNLYYSRTFQGPEIIFIIFKDFPGIENTIAEIKDFQASVRTL